MKTFGKLQKAILITLLLANLAFKTNAQSAEAVTYQVFYDALSPFGTWIHDATHGYVWQPKLGSSFRPYYSSGSWVMTEYGSTWVSTYPWGWAPFHYGRWVVDALYGWVWIPGMEWGPSWVVWRANGDLYGWIPLIPGYTITQSFGNNIIVPADWWVFVPSKQLLNPAFQQYSKSSASFGSSVMKTTHVINGIYTSNNTNYISGPRALEFTKSTGQHVTVYTIKPAAKPGKSVVSKEEITLYTPVLKKWTSGIEPKPAKFTKAEHDIGQLAAVSSTGGGSAQHSTTTKKKSSGHSSTSKTKSQTPTK